MSTYGDMDGIKDYLEQLDKDIQTADTVVKTGNPMTDVIINTKISLAKSRQILVKIDDSIPDKHKTSGLDLCNILENLYGNATEASMQFPEEPRLIRVYMDMKNTQLNISFTNFTAGKKLPKIGSRFHSSKGEGRDLSLVQIDKNVEHLDEYLSRIFEDGVFTTEILIPQV